MLISCPNCKATFAVPAKAIGETGKKVKCSKCGHHWHQDPIRFDKSELDNLLSATNLGSDSNLPTKIVKKINKISIAASVILVLLTGVLQALLNSESNEFLANTLNLKSYDNLKLVNFKSESQLNDNKLDFKLNGIIINKSEKKLESPNFEIEILSKGNRVISSAIATAEKPELEPYATLSFNHNLAKVTGNADKIVINYGNWLEKLFR